MHRWGPMANRARLERMLRLATAALVLVASIARPSLAPLHAAGPTLQPIKTAAAPCHQHAPVQRDAACDALCAIAASGHFIGEIACAPQLDGAKLTLPPAAAVLAAPRVVSGPAFPPAVRRSDGPPLYLATQRLRI